MKYLIKDKGYNNYKMAGYTASYCNDPGQGIHSELPSWMNEDGDCETEIIKSTDPQFKVILRERMIQAEHEINIYESKLRSSRNSFNIIIQTLEELANE